MRWGVYGRSGFEGSAAFIAGLSKAGVVGQERSASDYGDGCLEPFDAVALFGLQWKGRRILEEYQAAGVPVVVLDYGYVRRTNHAHDWRTGHWQVSLGGLNVLPPASLCSPDRFAALGVEIAERGGDPDGYPLLTVQTTGDASHGMDERALREWAWRQAAQWHGLLIRPHPLQEHLTYGLPVCEAPTLDAALAGARVLVTGNSNSGHEALLAGVPAIATLPGAAWDDLSGPELPGLDQRLAHFERCAYGQWTWHEFREGLPQRFLMDRWLPTSCC